MKKILSVVLMVFIFGPFVFGQYGPNEKPKAYQAWIQLKNNPEKQLGYLWGVSDSSVFLVQSLYLPKPREYNREMINLLKIRRDRSISRAATTGSVIGAVTGIIVVNSVEGGMLIPALPASSLAAVLFGALGAGFGALTGTIKDRIPIGGNRENFSRYKGSLQHYSFLPEPVLAPEFRHRGYFGAEAGVSMAGGEFAAFSDIPLQGYQRMVKTGTVMVTQGGYRFTPNFGLNLALVNHMYSLELEENSPSGEYSPYWGFDALIISPVLSWPFHEKWRLDFSPGIGYAGTTLSGPEDFVLNGEGFGYQLKGSLSWHYAKRWKASLGSGFLSSDVKYKEGGSGRARAFSITAGVAYLFGKKSL